MTGIKGKIDQSEGKDIIAAIIYYDLQCVSIFS
jgi:hypothetical protein